MVYNVSWTENVTSIGDLVTGVSHSLTNDMLPLYMLLAIGIILFAGMKGKAVTKLPTVFGVVGMLSALLWAAGLVGVHVPSLLGLAFFVSIAYLKFAED